MASTNPVQTQNGAYENIAANASPGLLFLKDFLPAFDSLGPFQVTPIPLANFLFQDSKFSYGRDPPVSAAAKLDMIRLRSTGVSRLERELHVARDFDLGSGSRRVIFESTTTTRFTNDPPGVEIVSKEATALDLLPTDTPGQGSQGLKMNKLTSVKIR